MMLYFIPIMVRFSALFLPLGVELSWLFIIA
jgi:hypothetical protein